MAEQMDQNIDQMITDKNLYLVFQLIGRKEYESAEAAIKLGIKTARDKCDANLEGLYYSAMGVLYKVQKDYKKAYKYYQQAEKLIKDDPAVSIISATLLIEQFKQYDTAAKK